MVAVAMAMAAFGAGIGSAALADQVGLEIPGLVAGSEAVTDASSA